MQCPWLRDWLVNYGEDTDREPDTLTFSDLSNLIVGWLKTSR